MDIRREMEKRRRDGALRRRDARTPCAIAGESDCSGPGATPASGFRTHRLSQMAATVHAGLRTRVCFPRLRCKGKGGRAGVDLPLCRVNGRAGCAAPGTTLQRIDLRGPSVETGAPCNDRGHVARRVTAGMHAGGTLRETMPLQVPPLRPADGSPGKWSASHQSGIAVARGFGVQGDRAPAGGSAGGTDGGAGGGHWSFRSCDPIQPQAARISSRTESRTRPAMSWAGMSGGLLVLLEQLGTQNLQLPLARLRDWLFVRPLAHGTASDAEQVGELTISQA